MVPVSPIAKRALSAYLEVRAACNFVSLALASKIKKTTISVSLLSGGKVSNSFKLRLNSNLDVEKYTKMYSEGELVRIENIFPDDIALEIETMLKTSMNWRLMFAEPDDTSPDGINVVRLTKDDIKKMNPQEFQARIQGVMDRATKSLGYLYNSYPMIEAYHSKWDPGHPIHTLTEFLNSAEFLEFGRRIIGVPNVTKVDAQATLYSRGDFLTRHVDHGFDNDRRAAYTFGFTKQWNSDWGGLLMLLTRKGQVTETFIPSFNVLTLFNGRNIHAVSSVSAFAGAGRLQLTGWLLDEGDEKAN